MCHYVPPLNVERVEPVKFYRRDRAEIELTDGPTDFCKEFVGGKIRGVRKALTVYRSGNNRFDIAPGKPRKTLVANYL